MTYYYITDDLKFVDASHEIDKPDFHRISEQMYLVTRLLRAGYSRDEIERAISDVFNLMDILQSKQV